MKPRRGKADLGETRRRTAGTGSRLAEWEMVSGLAMLLLAIKGSREGTSFPTNDQRNKAWVEGMVKAKAEARAATRVGLREVPECKKE